MLPFRFWNCEGGVFEASVSRPSTLRLLSTRPGARETKEGGGKGKRTPLVFFLLPRRRRLAAAERVPRHHLLDERIVPGHGFDERRDGVLGGRAAGGEALAG